MHDPQLQDARHIQLRVTDTEICGSDLLLYRGKVQGLKHGDVLSHEFMGVRDDTGSAVTHVRWGTRVVTPFGIACSACYVCERDLFADWETTNDGCGAILNKKATRPARRRSATRTCTAGCPAGKPNMCACRWLTPAR